MLEVDDTRILVDCGLYQERQFASRNWDPFVVPPASLRAVLLTHAHLDHCGLLPKLVKEGFKGRIFCTAATAEIAQIVLLVAAKIQEEDAAFKRKRHKKEGRQGPHGDQPLYTAEDVEKCLPPSLRWNMGIRWQSPRRGGVFSEAGTFWARRSSMSASPGMGTAATCCSLEMSAARNRPISRDPDRAKDGDYILIESTYGDRVHGGREDIKAAIGEVIRQTRAAGGNLIVPSFALNGLRNCSISFTSFSTRTRSRI
jgi:metallo-beta-lactamase family protein